MPIICNNIPRFGTLEPLMAKILKQMMIDLVKNDIYPEWRLPENIENEDQPWNDGIPVNTIALRYPFAVTYEEHAKLYTLVMSYHGNLCEMDRSFSLLDLTTRYGIDKEGIYGEYGNDFIQSLEETSKKKKRRKKAEQMKDLSRLIPFELAEKEAATYAVHHNVEKRLPSLDIDSEVEFRGIMYQVADWEDSGDDYTDEIAITVSLKKVKHD